MAIVTSRVNHPRNLWTESLNNPVLLGAFIGAVTRPDVARKTYVEASQGTKVGSCCICSFEYSVRPNSIG